MTSMSLAAFPWPGALWMRVPAVLCVVPCLGSLQTWLSNAVTSAVSPAAGAPHTGTLSYRGVETLCWAAAPLLQGHSMCKTGGLGLEGMTLLLGSKG